jgi:hypothetical protein
MLRDVVHDVRAPDQSDIGRIETVAHGADALERLTVLERTVDRVIGVNLRVIPGVLQTPSYASGMLAAANPRLTHYAVRHLTRLRNARALEWAGRLELGPRPGARFVLGERAVTRTWGVSADWHGIHAGQLRKLLRMAEHLQLHLLPDATVPPGWAEHFSLLEWGSAEKAERMAYWETPTAGWYSTREDDLAAYYGYAGDMISAALGHADTVKYIREVLGE